MRSKGLFWAAMTMGVIAVAAYVAGGLYSGLPGGGYGGRGGTMGGMMGGCGMMSGGGSMMGGGCGMMGGGGSMMGMTGGPVDAATAPLTIDQARDAVGRYLDYWGNSDLKARQVIEYANDYYARVEEQSSGAGAFELLVDRNTGVVYHEPGPSMMWNTKYGSWGSGGMMGGMMSGMMGVGTGGGAMGSMMGGRFGQARTTATTDMPLKGNDARDRAQKFLDRQLPGSKAGDPHTFYGYYTVYVEKDGRNIGMLSVDGYYGQIWFHSWHGAFLSEKQY